MTVSQHILRTLLAVLLPVALGLAWLLYSGWQAQQAGMREQLDALALQHQGDIQAWKDEIQATNYTNQSALQSASAEAYGAQYHDPLMAAGGSLLQGAGQIGMNWYKMTNTKSEP